ncbi:MAG: ATP-grasp domain-containing protein [Caldilineaceae bacterium]|nr:ATP-grasp domain-containing protein [Caldilineaceae bacterium]
MPKLMLLTTDRSYRNNAFFQAAQRLDIDVLPVVDMTPALAAQWPQRIGVDFGRPDDAAEALAAIARAHDVHAVLAVDDAGTLIAAKTAQHLGLPHNDPAAAEAARDKLTMRTMMAAGGVGCPWFRAFTTDQNPRDVVAQAPYPCVVKPVNLNGSRGVMRADTPDELMARLARLARLLAADQPDGAPHAYLVEGFIPGREVALEGLLDDGRLIVLALFDKPDPLDGPFFEETIYVTPSRLPDDVQAAIARCVEDAALALGLRTGPVHAELRVNDAGPWMLEVAGRSIGGLCSQTLRFGVDASLEELILRQACGLPLPSTQRAGRASGVMMIPIPAAGVLQRVDGVDAARTVPGIEGVEITAKLHYGLTPLPEGDAYLGFIFARGDAPSAVEDALRLAHRQLHFTILPEFSLDA